jgi:hypothetical protein
VRQVAPAPAYDEMWTAVVRCSGLPMPEGMSAAWTVSAAPGDAFYPPGKTEPVPGYTFVETHNIVVLAKYAHPGSPLLAHEMIHALLWVNGHHAVDQHHARREFLDCEANAQ